MGAEDRGREDVTPVASLRRGRMDATAIGVSASPSSFRRIGGTPSIKVDVRVVAAKNRRLREDVRRREFSLSRGSAAHVARRAAKLARDL